MEENDFLKEFRKVDSRIKTMDAHIKQIQRAKNRIMDTFLSHLPFQSGDIVERPDGMKLIIVRLKSALFLSETEIRVRYVFRKIKKNGELYSKEMDSYGEKYDYFHLKKCNI